MTNVGWIGLGAMGSPMASFVAKAGHAVTAFDIDPQKAAALAGDGVKAAATIGDAAADADVLVLMVATAEQAESVLYGDGDAAAALKPGSVVLLMATVGPAAVEDWAKRLEPAGVRSSMLPFPVVPPAPGTVICSSWSAARRPRSASHNPCWT